MDRNMNEREQNFEIELEAKKISDSLVDKMVSYRKKMRLTQQDVADVTGIKRANIARIESKRHAVSLESLLKYADCLNLELCIDVKERQE